MITCSSRNETAGTRKKILVIGASGGAGRLICREVVRLMGARALVVGDHNVDRGSSLALRMGIGSEFRFVDVLDSNSIARSVSGVDVVIVAVSQKTPGVQAVCVDMQVPCIDIGIQPDFVATTKQLDAVARANKTAVILLAGLFPGLSGLLVKAVTKSLGWVYSIDVGLLQNSNSAPGPTGIADMLGIYSQPVVFKSKKRAVRVPGFTVKKKIKYPEPFNIKEHRLIDYVESSAIREIVGSAVINYWTGSDKFFFDKAMAWLNGAGLLTVFTVPGVRMVCAKQVDRLMGLMFNPSLSETCAISVVASGRRDNRMETLRHCLVVPSDYGTTAMSVVAMAILMLRRDFCGYGVMFPFDAFSLQDVLKVMKCPDVRLSLEKNSVNNR